MFAFLFRYSKCLHSYLDTVIPIRQNVLISQ